MKNLFSEILNFKTKLIILIAVVCGNSFCLSRIPVIFSEIIDGVTEQKNAALMTVPIVKMTIMAVCALLFGFLMAKLASIISMGVGRNLRKRVFEKVQDFSSDEIEEFSVSSLIVRTNSDITVVQFFMTAAMGMVLGAPVTFVISVITAFLLSAELAVVMIPMIGLVAAIVVVINRKAERLSAQMQTELDRINLLFRERLSGVKVIRAFGREKLETEKFNQVNLTYTILSKHQSRLTQTLMPAFLLILGVTIVVMLWIAFSHAAGEGNMITTGEQIAVIQLVITILLQVAFLAIVMMMLPRAGASAARIREVLEKKITMQERTDAAPADRMRGYLEFRNVSYTYPGAQNAALSGLSFQTGPGEVTAIIGSTGAGKTTAVNLIPRLKDATEGNILVDGIDVRDFPLETLRAKIGFVPQKSMLFTGTIRSNLRFGDENAGEEAIRLAVETAQASDFVEKKQGGYDAQVDEGGSNFSGGQRQRLCIARALVRTPEIYVFDDSFSALDFKTDSMLRAALKKRTGDATVVIVTQRVGTVMDADRIIVLENGTVCGTGTHQELLASCPVYKEIVSSQLGKEAAEA